MRVQVPPRPPISIHESEESLSRKLAEAASLVERGNQYSHYKDPSKVYEITDFGIWEPTDEVSVIYRASYGKRLTFIRLLAVFLETVELDGSTVPRFKRLDS